MYGMRRCDVFLHFFFFFQAEGGIRDAQESRGLGIGKQVDNGQQVCGGLARTRLGAGYKVVSFQNNIDALLLNGGALFKIHCIEGVQYVVAQRKFVKSHNLIIINSPAVCLIGRLNLTQLYIERFFGGINANALNSSTLLIKLVEILRIKVEVPAVGIGAFRKFGQFATLALRRTSEPFATVNES